MDVNKFKSYLPLIKPVGKDENGKYNKKLYNLLKKIRKDTYGNEIKIWFNTSSRWDGSYINFHKNIHKDNVNIVSQIMIDPYGKMNSGYFLSSAIQKNNPTHFSLCTFDPDEMVDITEWFMDTYSKMGRCMFDSNHYDFDNKYNNRYYIINKNRRKCRWCGEHFHREIEKVVEVRKYETWEETNKKETV